MLFANTIILALASLATAKPPSSQGTFAVNYFYGTGPLTEGRMDPIVSKGEIPSNHVHTFMGGSGLSPDMDGPSALDAQCTNSKPKADKTNYWWPKMYFRDPDNGSYIDVDMYYAKAYYFFEPSDDEIKTIPAGLHMIAGDAMRRSPNDKGGELNIDSGAGTINPVQFVCGGSETAYSSSCDGTMDPEKGGCGVADPNLGGHGVGFPDANCDGFTTPLRYDIHFPSCVNPDADLDDYVHNTAYPSTEGASMFRQNCPPGWIHIPHIFIEVYWNTPPFADLWEHGQGKQPFVLAQGDPTGYGLHGDIIAGWDEDALQALIDDCNAGDAGFDKCPNIDSAGGVNPSSDECHVDFPLAEKIKGPMDQLPGCNPLQWGPGSATIQTTNCGGSGSSPDNGTSSTTTSPAASSSAVASGSSSMDSGGSTMTIMATTTSAVASPVGDEPSVSESTSSWVSSSASASASNPVAVESSSSTVAPSDSLPTTSFTTPSSPIKSGTGDSDSDSGSIGGLGPGAGSGSGSGTDMECKRGQNVLTKTVVEKVRMTVTVAPTPSPEVELKARANNHLHPRRHVRGTL